VRWRFRRRSRCSHGPDVYQVDNSRASGHFTKSVDSRFRLAESFAAQP
jgi:hypothetical protein